MSAGLLGKVSLARLVMDPEGAVNLGRIRLIARFASHAVE